ncbi:thioredoxin family protein [Qipengyuania gelatinilytica]|uniref:Thioredoxin family protein n=1 Tax=Qipengyuania gelatinilytica TaxID=2867231 RepID=A0ABX8ZZY5_9SPHN|nr:thioredoxin family protein [Qipengyuania gelatinilytica]QZD94464.1 thioredoxin family protein [Qipengyuania gelatinilytica]
MKNAVVLVAALLLSACASTPEAPVAHHPEARSFAVTADASADVDAALERALSSGKHVMLVMGANWCHDSRALAGWLETPRFQKLVEAEYELVFVNVGMPQTGDGHNLEIARRFGLEELPGTPNLLVLTPFGTLVNADTATTWRNAASRSEDEIYDELVRLAS